MKHPPYIVVRIQPEKFMVCRPSTIYKSVQGVSPVYEHVVAYVYQNIGEAMRYADQMTAQDASVTKGNATTHAVGCACETCSTTAEREARDPRDR